MSVVPLESDPEVFSELAHTIGLSPVLLFHDVYSLTDPELVAFIPQPVMAIIVLFPISAGYEADRQKTPATPHSPVRWFKQTIRNGCGLYALLHALANLSPDFVVEDLPLNKLVLQNLVPGMSPEDAAQLVVLLEKSIQLDANFGLRGQTDAPSADDDIQFHFTTFVKGLNGHVYELDGRRSGPVDLGETVPDLPLLADSKVADRVKFYMDITDDRDKDKFAVMALAPAL